jgi:hypothetical protein
MESVREKRRSLFGTFVTAGRGGFKKPVGHPLALRRAGSLIPAGLLILIGFFFRALITGRYASRFAYARAALLCSR